MASITKDPVKVRAGTIGARARWGDEPRVVRLGSLDPRVRAAVVALIRADEASRASLPGQLPIDTSAG